MLADTVGIKILDRIDTYFHGFKKPDGRIIFISYFFKAENSLILKETIKTECRYTAKIKKLTQSIENDSCID